MAGIVAYVKMQPLLCQRGGSCKIMQMCGHTNRKVKIKKIKEVCFCDFTHNSTSSGATKYYVLSLTGERWGVVMLMQGINITIAICFEAVRVAKQANKIPCAILDFNLELHCLYVCSYLRCFWEFIIQKPLEMDKMQRITKLDKSFIVQLFF